MRSRFRNSVLACCLLLACLLQLTANTLAAASETPRVSRAMLVASEKSLDDRVSRLWDDNPFVLLGPTRGIYLEGYGAVFTAEVNLVLGPVFAMVQPLPVPEDVSRHQHQIHFRGKHRTISLQINAARGTQQHERIVVPQP